MERKYHPVSVVRRSTLFRDGPASTRVWHVLSNGLQKRTIGPIVGFPGTWFSSLLWTEPNECVTFPHMATTSKKKKDGNREEEYFVSWTSWFWGRKSASTFRMEAAPGCPAPSFLCSPSISLRIEKTPLRPSSLLAASIRYLLNCAVQQLSIVFMISQGPRTANFNTADQSPSPQLLRFRTLSK